MPLWLLGKEEWARSHVSSLTHTCPRMRRDTHEHAVAMGEEACADITAVGDALGNVHFLDLPQERQVCGFSNPY